jgi:CPA2 family monovalent cation:H+ antiporter-2
MLFEPRVLIEQPLHVLATVAVIVVGKSAAALALVLLLRYPAKTALQVSASLAQIGEFSFILAGLGMQLGLLPKAGQSLILAGALISIALNPLVFSGAAALQRWLLQHPRFAIGAAPAENPLASLPMATEVKFLHGHLVLVGWGRVGKRIAAELKGHGLPLVVVEQNREYVQALRAQGLAAIWGDATEDAVLIQAHIKHASVLVIATPETLQVRPMVDIARALNGHIHILIRSHNAEEAAMLERDGAGSVFDGERELADAIVRAVLQTVPVDRAPRFAGEQTAAATVV